ncbi:hypothetical protein [Halalkalibacter oceani]|uniref:Uncharacterized protein n=1 Tax=Halalkalibacter oceani TaxID=1653776 RepID=A0A9X2INC3_9BACI|nr:hypothetical protein [Halalkalibacter oceani]MCM3713646.1 hypothetical protein [Halalkalibacter oceani]
MNIDIELFQWLNRQTDLNSSQIDLVDGFVFMLRKIKQHGSIRMVGNREFHSRFWRSHDRAFGYQLMKKKGRQQRAHLYQFYCDIAFEEALLKTDGTIVTLTEAGEAYLRQSKDKQLDLLFSYIW